MSSAYPISSPVEFVNTTAADTLNFNADGPAVGAENHIENFVVTTAGDLLYRASGGSNLLERLAIGTAGQVLTVVGGLPAWATPTPGSTSETFLATASAAAGTVAASATYTDVDSALVTWDDSTAPNHDAGANFTPGTGVFVVPATGIYTISASVSFDGNNTGTSGTITGRRAIRQARIQKTNATAYTVAFAERQPNAFNSNPTQLYMVAANASLTAGDTLVLQVRHDASTALGLNNEDATGSASSPIYFSAARQA